MIKNLIYKLRVKLAVWIHPEQIISVGVDKGMVSFSSAVRITVEGPVGGGGGGSGLDNNTMYDSLRYQLGCGRDLPDSFGGIGRMELEDWKN